MQDLKQNFKFIDGFINKFNVRDEKGVITNHDWRVESNIQKKIIKPTQVINNCQKSLNDLLNKNENYCKYIDELRKIRGRHFRVTSDEDEE
jgi:hypothetical protein